MDKNQHKMFNDKQWLKLRPESKLFNDKQFAVKLSPMGIKIKLFAVKHCADDKIV